MRRVISDHDLWHVASQRRHWRFTDLHTALMHEFACGQSTATRAIQRGITNRYLVKSGRLYHLTTAPHPPPRRADGTTRRLVPDRLLILEIASERDHWLNNELVRELAARLKLDPTVVHRNLGYARAHGYIEPIYGAWRITNQARNLLTNYGRLQGAEGYRFATFLSGKPMKDFNRWAETNPPAHQSEPTSGPAEPRSSERIINQFRTRSHPTSRSI